MNVADREYHEAANAFVARVRRLSETQLKRLINASHKASLHGNEQDDLVAEFALHELSRRVDVVEFLSFYKRLFQD
jgi:hypothetical protein